MVLAHCEAACSRFENIFIDVHHKDGTINISSLILSDRCHVFTKCCRSRVTSVVLSVSVLSQVRSAALTTGASTVLPSPHKFKTTSTHISPQIKSTEAQTFTSSPTRPVI